MPNPVIQKVISTLKKADLSTADRSLLISAIIDKLAAVPLRDIIIQNDKGEIIVQGQKVDIEEMNQLRVGAIQVLNSKTFRLIRKQVLYETFVYAVHKSATPEDLIMGKAAIWWSQQLDKFLELLSYEDRTPATSSE